MFSEQFHHDKMSDKTAEILSLLQLGVSQFILIHHACVMNFCGCNPLECCTDIIVAVTESRLEKKLS